MGLLDFLGKKKKEEQEAAELLKTIIQYQVESRKDGVDTDDIPKGYTGFAKRTPFRLAVFPAPTNTFLSFARRTDAPSRVRALAPRLRKM